MKRDFADLKVAAAVNSNDTVLVTELSPFIIYFSFMMFLNQLSGLLLLNFEVFLTHSTPHSSLSTVMAAGVISRPSTVKAGDKQSTMLTNFAIISQMATTAQ